MISYLRANNIKTKPKKRQIFLFRVKLRNILKLRFKKYIQFFIQLYIMEVPQHCPGTESATAGKVAACQGCPNQTVCSSGVSRQPNIGAELVKARLSSVKNIILVLSGKGGVGKSTFTSLLARCIAGGNEDVDVAILDIDICGPSMPRVMGVLGEQVHGSGSGWSPVFVEDNLCVMSIGFMLPNQDDAIIWRGPRKNGMIRQFLSDVDWGDSLDYLIIDTPPGTSDEHLAVTQFLKNIENVSAVVLTTPQEISLLDVRKEIDFLKKVNVSIIGVIENMSSFVCPKCKCSTQIFPRDTGGAVKMCKELDVPYLGSIPLDPLVARCCDEGLNPFEKYPDSLAVTAVKTIVPKIIDHDKINVTEENKQ